MGLNLPSDEQEVIDQSRSDVQEVIPDSNPFLANSFLDALITATGGRVFDFYRQLEILAADLFIDTAIGESLDRLASFRNITRNPAAASEGNVVFSGTAGSIIPISTTLQSSDAQEYTTQSDTTIADNSIAVAITRSGSTATAVSGSPHNLASGIDVTISGAAETEYNGTFPVNVTSATAFTYIVPGSPSSPATGVPLAAYSTGLGPVESTDEGEITNQASGASLALGSPIAGVNSSAFVDFDGLQGGTDEESDEDFRTRAIEKYQNPNTPFNVAGITSQAKLVPGVTRVFVREITPDVGQVTVFFTRDNDEGSSIPSASEVADVEESILLIKPAHTLDEDVIVEAPVAVTVDFTISNIDPSSTTMQTAIINNLEQLFDEDTDVGVALKRNDYISAINRTVDTESGDILQDFNVDSPTGDVSVLTNELPILGTVSFI